MHNNIGVFKKILYFIVVAIFVVFTSYTLSEGLEEKYVFLGAVNVNNLNLRAGPNKNYYSFLQLMRDDILIILDREYDWYKVQLPPKANCYVKTDLLKLYKEKVVSRVDNLNIHCKPGLNYTVVGQLQKGEVAYYKSFGSDWIKIYPTKKTYGWVYYKYIDRIKEAIKNGVSLHKRSYSYPENIQREVSSSEENLPYAFKDNQSTTVKLSTADKSNVVKDKTGDSLENNISLKKNQELSDNKVKVRGYVKDSGFIIYRPGTHKLEDDLGNLLYYLKSYEYNLNQYKNNKVEIEGVKKLIGYYKNPIIVVSKIKYVND